MRSVHEWLESAQELIHAALPDAAVVDEPGSEGWRPDLLYRLGNAYLALEFKVVRAPRIAEVEGQIAKAILQLKRYASSVHQVPVVLVGLPKFGPKLEKAIRLFMGEHASNVGWGLMDERGRAILEIPPLKLSWERAASLPEWGKSLSGRRDRQLFTDLNRWLLKVLLLNRAPGSLWGGPCERPRHPTELAEIARVSIGKAHGFASAFQEQGYLRKTDSGLRLARVQELLDAWLQDEKTGSPRAIPVRSMVPHEMSLLPSEQRPEEPALPAAAWSDSAVGGVFAALHQGMLRVGGRQLPLVHVRIPMAKAIHEWSIEKCEMRDAQFVLSEPLFPKSVFRGTVKRQDAAPLVDIWQVALDSASSAARGQEQADFIVQRILSLQEDS